MKNDERMTVRMTNRQRTRIGLYAKQRGLSESSALVELAELGLDAALSGAGSRAEMDERIRSDLYSLRGLCAEAIYASDATSRLVLDLFEDGVDQVEEFRKARAWAKQEAQKIKKSA